MAVKPFVAEATATVDAPPRKIALAVDASPESWRAVTLTKSLAAALGAEVTVLHFRETVPEGVPAESAEAMLDLVTDVVGELAGAGIVVSADVEESGPLGEATPIAHAAERFEAQLIVVGSRGLSTGRALLKGSVSHDLIHATRIPVLVVR